MPMRERVHIKYPYIYLRKIVVIVIIGINVRNSVFLCLSDGKESCFVLNGGGGGG